MGVNVGMYVCEDDAHVVRFALETDFLNKFTAKQWGIIPKKPVVVQLKFEEVYTAADDIPGIFIFQSGDSRLSEPSLNDYETEFGVVQWFLETRLTEVLRGSWEKRPTAVRTRAPSIRTPSPLPASATPPATPSPTTLTATTTPSTTASSSTTTTTTTSPSTTTTTSLSPSTTSPSSPLGPRGNSGLDLSVIPLDEALLEQLKGVGFEEERARAALRRFTNDFEMALNYLLTSPSDRIESPEPSAMTMDSIAVDVKMEKESEAMASSTPEKGKKRSLTVSDDNTFAQLVNLGFDVDEVIEVLAEHPSGTSFDTLHNALKKQSSHTPKKQRGSDEDEEKLDVLKGLGLSTSEAKNALEMAQGDLAMAVELIDKPLTEEEEVPDSVPEANYGFGTPKAPIRHGRGGRRIRRLSPGAKENNFQRQNADDIPPAKNEVNLWDENPFLVNLYNYINMRFITCPGYCLICDRDLDITTYKLPVCGRTECARVYESTACGKNQVITEIKEQPAVVELLLNLLCACMSSPGVKGWNRNGNVLSTKIDGSDGAGVKNGNRYGYVQHVSVAHPQSFEPFPYNLGFEFDNGGQNIKLLQKTVDSIPKISELLQCSSDVHLQALLDEAASPLAFPLLRWLLRSSRAHLSLIPENKQIMAMGTPYQFQIVSTNPEHERTFQKWKQQAREEKPKLTQAQKQQNTAAYMGAVYTAPQYVPRPGGGFMLKPEEKKPAEETKRNTGSYHAFHGSPISNWHSILRTGLRGGHVPGIYMAQSAAVSQGYMQSGTQCSGWKNSTWDCDKNMACMGMVEVADMCHHTNLLTGASPVELPEAALAGVINVAMDYSLVVTRYLFFWPRGLFPDMQANIGQMNHIYAGSPFTNVIASRLIKNEFLFLDDDEEREEKSDLKYDQEGK
eukprot:Phypoly_transcript_02394.p1 GENE.Phypoly_transcript_02394~~Phypoly_transcript_02394.p1  ORF type:complete len:924 (+),score=160.91 Phypoly_transcript_02394:68-2773(+)